MTKPKIFITSLHRTATQSVHYMLEEAGFKSIHWPSVVDGIDYEAKIKGREADFLYVTQCIHPVIAENDVISDVPIPGIYEFLSIKYPNSLFITITRSAKSWISSVRKHIGTEREFDSFEKTLYWKYIKRRPNYITEISDEELENMHIEHLKNLDKFFFRSNNHVFFDLSDPLIGQKICKFVGVEPKPLPKRDYYSEHQIEHKSSD